MRPQLSPGTSLETRQGLGCTMRSGGLGCSNCPVSAQCTKKNGYAARSGLSCPMGLSGLGCCGKADRNGLGCTMRSEGLGSLPGPSLMDELIAQFSSIAGQFLQLDAQMLSIHNRLLEAVRIAEGKGQLKLSSEAQASVRALANMRSQYLRVRTSLSDKLSELQKLKQDYEAGNVGIVTVGLTTARIAFQGGLDVRVAHSLLNDVPRFEQNAAALIEQINGAQSMEPKTALTDIPGQITGNLAQFAMWISITAGIFFVAPTVMRAFRRK